MTRKKRIRQIVQIMPAAGSFTVVAVAEPRHFCTAAALLARALMTDAAGAASVQGMDGSDYVGFTDDNANFLRYTDESGMGAKWRADVTRAVKAWLARKPQAAPGVAVVSNARGEPVKRSGGLAQGWPGKDRRRTRAVAR